MVSQRAVSTGEDTIRDDTPLERETCRLNRSPSLTDSDVSSADYGSEDEHKSGSSCEQRTPLQWVFKGLTIWIEYEEHDRDLSRAVEDASQFYGTEQIPMPHSTAIYGMTHFSDQQATEKLLEVGKAFPNGWPSIMDKPISVKQDLAVEGRPGQVCSISWSELTLKTNEQHEEAIDKLCEIFEVNRARPWTPHLSLAYDNPEDSVLNLADTIGYVAQNPSFFLLVESRRCRCGTPMGRWRSGSAWIG